MESPGKPIIVDGGTDGENNGERCQNDSRND